MPLAHSMLHRRLADLPSATGLCFALSAVLLHPARTLADNFVSYASVSHDGDTDRTPICPVGGQSFTIEFLTLHDDLTAARVGVDEDADGVGIVWIDATIAGTVGPLDRWTATIPATSATTLAYILELTDGFDQDYLGAAGYFDTLPSTGWWELNFQTLAHAPLGATPVTGGTVFRVWAPGASSASVRGTFNNWSAAANPMTRLGEDFIAFVPNASVGQRYKYWFNGSTYKTDPRARSINNLDNYNATILNPLGYTWLHPQFTPAPPEQWVVYQVHVGTFAGRNDPMGSTPTVSRFSDLAARVGHLTELGVNAVMLNPCNEFPGSQSGGYNPISAFAIETSYGGPEEFKAMVDALHGAGIAVILDVVWNHFASNDNFLWNFDGTQAYFDTPAVDTPWGAQADFDEPAVADYFVDALETLFGEFRLDGLRHDAIFEVVGAAQAAAGQDMIERSMDLAHRRFPDTHVIGEVYNNNPWNTSPAGIDLDGQYHEAFKNAVHDAAFAAAFGSADMTRLAATIDGTGPFVEGEAVLNYFELHDEAWPLSGSNRAVKEIDTTAPHDDRYALGRTKVANGITLLAQGMPAILMGTEWAEDAGWETEKIDWSHKTTYRKVFDFYRDLIGLRTTIPALFANAPIDVFHVNDGADVLAWERSGPDGRSYVMIASLSNADFAQYSVGLPRSGSWGLILNSEDALYQGRGLGGSSMYLDVSTTPRDGFAQSTTLTVPAHSLLVLQHDPEFLRPPVDPCATDRSGDGAFNVEDIYVVMALDLDVNADGTHDARDASCLIDELRSSELTDTTSTR